MAWGFGNSGAAGGGGLNRHDALLRVQAPAHSVVTITKGAYHKSDVGHENADDHTVYDYYFIIHQSQFDSVNPWTVTATTTDEITNTKIIIIEAADEYDVILRCLVPNEYQAVEYLRGTGTQYINTGIAPLTTQWGFEVKYNIQTAFGGGGGTYGCLMGKRVSGGNNEYQLSTYSQSTTGGLLRLKDTSYSAYMTRYTTETASLHNCVYTRPNGQTFSVANSTLTNLPLYLFGCNTNGSVEQKIDAYLYSLKLFNESDEKVADYYPCYRKSDSVAGLWDRVNKEFLTNSGSGTFTVGSDII